MALKGSKYDPLHVFLRTDRRDQLCLSLEEIEDILGFDLSASAAKAGWWVNPVAVRARAQTWSWIDAGYEASMRHGLVTFRRVPAKPVKAGPSGQATTHAAMKRSAIPARH